MMAGIAGELTTFPALLRGKAPKREGRGGREMKGGVERRDRGRERGRD